MKLKSFPSSRSLGRKFMDSHQMHLFTCTLYVDIISIAIKGTASYNWKNAAPDCKSKRDPNQNFEEPPHFNCRQGNTNKNWWFLRTAWEQTLTILWWIVLQTKWFYFQSVCFVRVLITLHAVVLLVDNVFQLLNEQTWNKIKMKWNN